MATAAPPSPMPSPAAIESIPPPLSSSPVSLSSLPSSIPNAPGQYGETQTHEGVEFVILNDDVLTSVANATNALDHGHPLERMAVLYQFPQFLEHCPHDTMNTMVPRICQCLMDSTPDVQMAAAEALYFVVNMRAPPDVAKHIVVATLTVISTSPEGEVFDACGEILSMMLPQVARPDVLELVVPATRQRAVSDRSESRRLAARIIGSLNDALTPDEMQNLFLQHALNLADDPDETVRAMMAQSLAAVGNKLPLRVSHDRLWPKLLILIKDENVRVRAAAMRALAKTVEHFHESAERSSMYTKVFKPLFLEECERARAVAIQDLRNVDDDTYLMLEIFSEVYGYFLVSLCKLFRSEKDWAIAREVYRSMASCNGPTVRHWCAFNMPAVATVLSSHARDVVVTLLQSLSIDTDVETRATLAAGIKETAAVLCRGAMRGEIIQSISTLFMDENAQVRMNALRHLSELVVLLSPGEEANLARVKAAMRTEQRKSMDPTKRNQADLLENPEADSAELRRLAQIFSSLEMMPFDSWRTQEILAEELRKSAHLVPQQMLCENVAPLLFQMARESTYLVRKASMRALMHTLRYIPDVRRRNHILKHFRQEWARGQVYWTRLAFIDGADFALDIVSTRLFNQMFKKELLRLTNDDVPNVKARLLKLFSRLAPRWGEEVEFVAALEVMIEDTDKQVSSDAGELLAKLRLLAPLSEEEREEEERREEEEDAFFVHKPRRKKPTPSVPPTKGASRPVPEGNIRMRAPLGEADMEFVRRPVNDLKDSPTAFRPSGHGTRINDMNPQGVAQGQGEPKKKSLFQILFGACFRS